jgi:ribose transport system substrate-binding protein
MTQRGRQVNRFHCIPILLIAIMAAFADGGCKEKRSDGTKGGGEGYTIAVIPKGTTHEFWQAVKAGADDAAREFHVRVIWKGPAKEDQRDDQIAVVESFVSDQVSGIVLAPLDSSALVAPVHGAAEKKIPVVIIDSSLKGEAGKDFVSFVATDNYKGGYAAGDALAKALGEGSKKVVLLRYAVGSASTEQREQGFLDSMAKHQMAVISKDQYAGATMAEAQTAADNLTDKLKEADGVFCPNESSTRGMLNSLQANHLSGKIKFVGFDASKPLVDAVRSGDITALVAQNPRNMGYLGVKTMVQHLKGETLPASIDTGSAVVTKENLSDPAIVKIIGGN